MYDINFEPYVGKDYYSQSPKVLVLGESHYAGEGDRQKDFTNYVVQRYAKRETGERLRFFTKIAKALDSHLDNDNAHTLWDKVAFYNYVQVIVGDSPRKRPSNEMLSNSNQAFRIIVEQLKPDIVVVLGRHLGRHLDWYVKNWDTETNSYITCNWTHPATPKYFKEHEAAEAFEVAKRQFIAR